MPTTPSLTGPTPFVGRVGPYAALHSAVEAAELGERVLALVAGEPGIGKTRLVAEVAAHVGAQAVWAACWEGDGVPPYWPWRQLLRDLEADRDAAGWALAELDRAGPAEPGADPRFRMFDAVAAALAVRSRDRPLLIVLDDLHWADEGTIRLLQFLARDTRPRRVAVVGTYRDTDLSPTHPLAVGLAELVRDGLHLSLGGLTVRDVSTLVHAVGDVGQEPQRLHRHSGGNPFFLGELLRLLQAGATLDNAPPGVRAVVRRRLDGLSEATRATLAAASVLGADSDLSILAELTDGGWPQVVTALAEAQVAGLAERSSDGRFGFVHALVREVLYTDLDEAARSALHRQTATVLEQRFGDDRAGEIAHHLFAGSTGEPDGRCIDQAVRAGERSLLARAYADAAHWFGRALDGLGSDEPGRGNLLLRTGAARLAAGDLAGAREAYRQAAALARQAGDAERLAHAALGLGAGLGGFEIQLLDPLQVDLLEEALAALDPDPSALRAWLLARLSVAVSLIADDERRRTLSSEAVEVARASGDRRALGYALAAQCDAAAGPDDCETRATAAAEIVALAEETGDRELEALGLRLRLVAELELGRTGSVDATLERFALVAERLGQPLYRWYVPLWRGMRDLMRGDLDASARHCAEAEEVGLRAGSANARFLTFTQWWVRERYLGRTQTAGSAMAELLAQAEPRFTVGPRAVVAALTGDLVRTRSLLEEWQGSGLADRSRDSEWLPESAQLAQAAVAGGAAEAAERLYADLRPYAHRYCVEGIAAACTGSVAWYLAGLARFLGRTAEADAYATQARRAHAQLGFRGDPPPIAPVDATVRPTPDTGPSLQWEGATWAVSWGERTARVRDSKGLRDLVVLLSRAGQEVHCLELVGGQDVGGEPGPALDDQARRAYQHRIRDLQVEIDEAREMADLARAERAEDELDALVAQLSEAFGLSGRSRGTGSAAERARSAVSWRIRATLRNLAEVHPELARHLQNSVRTGTWCAYRPETEVSWSLVSADSQGRRA